MKIIQQPILIEVSRKELKRLTLLLTDCGMDALSQLHGVRTRFIEGAEGGKQRVEEAKIERVKEIAHYLYELEAIDKIKLLMNCAYHRELIDIYDYIQEEYFNKA